MGSLADLIVSQTRLIRSACWTASTVVSLLSSADPSLFPTGEGPPNAEGPTDSFASMLMLTFACTPFVRCHPYLK